MVDYTNSRERATASYPIDVKETTPLLKRIEPIITPKLLKSRYLKGIVGIDYSDGEIKDQINLAINETETLTNIPLNKIQVAERIMYDQNLYRSFVYVTLDKKPVLSIDKMAIESSDGVSVFNIPPEWLEVGNLTKLGQINIMPILNIFGASGLTTGSATNAGLLFVQAISRFRWLPAFWTVYYTTGVCHEEGQLPVVMNEVVGMTAAIEILSNMQNRNILQSQAISQDGVSQSSSSAGPQIYQARIEQLKEKRDKLMKRLKTMYKQNIFVGSI